MNDARAIIDSARVKAYAAVNVALVERNWLLGKCIAEEELQGEGRAAYGANVIQKLSKELTDEYGRVLLRVTYTNFASFTGRFQRFSTRCVENQQSYYLGHITEHYCRCWTLRLVLGICRRR